MSAQKMSNEVVAKVEGDNETQNSTRKTLEDIDREFKEYLKRHPKKLERVKRDLRELELLSKLANTVAKERKSDYVEGGLK
jgi:glutaredoxin 2